jgi:hypothetical protein
LWLDDAEGAAVRSCSSCGLAHPIGDSDEFLEDAELGTCACPCGAEEFEIAAGVALSEAASDQQRRAVKWLYLGCRCTACGLTAVYGDWNNEHEDYRSLLSSI